MPSSAKADRHASLASHPSNSMLLVRKGARLPSAWCRRGQSYQHRGSISIANNRTVANAVACARCNAGGVSAFSSRDALSMLALQFLGSRVIRTARVEQACQFGKLPADRRHGAAPSALLQHRSALLAQCAGRPRPLQSRKRNGLSGIPRVRGLSEWLGSIEPGATLDRGGAVFTYHTGVAAGWIKPRHLLIASLDVLGRSRPYPTHSIPVSTQTLVFDPSIPGTRHEGSKWALKSLDIGRLFNSRALASRLP
jgi:hypothetical protein